MVDASMYYYCHEESGVDGSSRHNCVVYEDLSEPLNIMTACGATVKIYFFTHFYVVAIMYETMQCFLGPALHHVVKIQ